jgi:NitT/TauT family transport system ATP-binding protein
MKESVKLNRISLTYQTPETEIKALENVSFTVHEGEFVSVIGPSGCGKTSVLSIIAGLIKPSSGELIFGGKSN